MHTIVRNVKVSQILEELKILLSHIVDVHAGELGSNGFMRQLDAARVKQEEAIKSTSGQAAGIQARLNLLAINLSFLVRPVDQPVIVFHLRLLLANLDHVVEIGDFDGEARLLLLPVNQALVSVVLTAPSLPEAFSFLLAQVPRVDRLSNAHLFELRI